MSDEIKQVKEVELTAFQCGYCGRTFIDGYEAEACCKCTLCGKRLTRTFRNTLAVEYCRECHESEQKKRSEEHSRISAERDAATMAKAELVPYVDGEPVFWLEINEFYRDMEELLDRYDDDELPEFVCPCKPFIHAMPDVKHIIEQMVEDEMYEDFDYLRLDGIDELDAALKKFSELNKERLTAFEADQTKKVKVVRP
jgi:hypothetical protein